MAVECQTPVLLATHCTANSPLKMLNSRPKRPSVVLGTHGEVATERKRQKLEPGETGWNEAGIGCIRPHKEQTVTSCIKQEEDWNKQDRTGNLLEKIVGNEQRTPLVTSCEFTLPGLPEILISSPSLRNNSSGEELDCDSQEKRKKKTARRSLEKIDFVSSVHRKIKDEPLSPTSKDRPASCDALPVKNADVASQEKINFVTSVYTEIKNEPLSLTSIDPPASDDAGHIEQDAFDSQEPPLILNEQQENRKKKIAKGSQVDVVTPVSTTIKNEPLCPTLMYRSASCDALHVKNREDASQEKINSETSVYAKIKNEPLSLASSDQSASDDAMAIERVTFDSQELPPTLNKQQENRKKKTARRLRVNIVTPVSTNIKNEPLWPALMYRSASCDFLHVKNAEDASQKKIKSEASVNAKIKNEPLSLISSDRSASDDAMSIEPAALDSQELPPTLNKRQENRKKKIAKRSQVGAVTTVSTSMKKEHLWPTLMYQSASCDTLHVKKVDETTSIEMASLYSQIAHCNEELPSTTDEHQENHQDKFAESSRTNSGMPVTKIKSEFFSVTSIDPSASSDTPRIKKADDTMCIERGPLNSQTCQYNKELSATFNVEVKSKATPVMPMRTVADLSFLISGRRHLDSYLQQINNSSTIPMPTQEVESQPVATSEYRKVLLFVSEYENGEWVLQLFDPDSKVMADPSPIEPKLYRRSAIVNIGHELYFIGGVNHSWDATKTVLKYDSCSNKWQQMKDLEIPRWAMGAGELQNSIYVVGGLTEDNVRLNQVDRFDLETSEWKTVAPLKTFRENPSVIAVNNLLFVVGGYTMLPKQRLPDDQTASGEVYNPSTNQWTLVNTPFGIGRKVNQKTFCITLLEGRAFIIRKRGCPVTSSHRFPLLYQFDLNSWESAQEILNLELRYVAHMCNLANDQICLVTDVGSVHVISPKLKGFLKEDPKKYYHGTMKNLVYAASTLKSK